VSCLLWCFAWPLAGTILDMRRASSSSGGSKPAVSRAATPPAAVATAPTAATNQVRTVSFVDRVVWDFVGNVYAPAALIGDVDRDGVRRRLGCCFYRLGFGLMQQQIQLLMRRNAQNNEFAVGNINGTLAIFKGLAAPRPWKVCNNLGTVRQLRHVGILEQ